MYLYGYYDRKTKNAASNADSIDFLGAPQKGGSVKINLSFVSS
jgi:hypothetical protein